MIKHYLTKNGETREVIEHYSGDVLVALSFIEGFINPEFDAGGRVVGWKLSKGVKRSSEKEFIKFKASVESAVSNDTVL